MKKIEFNIVINEKIPPFSRFSISWDGYNTDVPGLVVCRPPKRDFAAGLRGFAKGAGWRVVHLQSGGYIGLTIDLRKNALELARRLGEVGCDWSEPYSTLYGFTDEIRKTIKDFCGAVSAPKPSFTGETEEK